MGIQAKYRYLVGKTRKCRRCGKSFQPTTPQNIYCSKRCCDRAWEAKMRKQYKEIPIGRASKYVPKFKKIRKTMYAEKWWAKEESRGKTHA